MLKALRRPGYVTIPISATGRIPQLLRMTARGPLAYVWKSIRLELAETPGFPRGSASRAYMLNLPMRKDGTVDEQAVRANPAIAGFRRFWPNEPDRRGHVVRTDGGWALSFQPATNGRTLFLIEMSRLLPGDEVMIEKSEGGSRPFRVVDLPPVDRQS